MDISGRVHKDNWVLKCNDDYDDNNNNNTWITFSKTQ